MKNEKVQTAKVFKKYSVFVLLLKIKPVNRREEGFGTLFAFEIKREEGVKIF
jgi:hypothetical protein